MTVVMLALDDTPQSAAAAEAARQLFGPDTTYFAVNVASVPPAWAPSAMVWGGVVPYAPDPAYSMDMQANTYTEAEEDAQHEAEKLAKGAGIEATPVGESGDAVEAIVRAAHDHHADVIVVGAAEKSFWHRLIEGSVAKDILRVAHIPVLVVPERSDDHHDEQPTSA